MNVDILESTIGYEADKNIHNTVRSTYYEQIFVRLIRTSAYCEHHSLVPNLLPFGLYYVEFAYYELS